MNARLSLATIADHLRTTLPSALGVARVGTGYDVDYLSAFAKTWPAVWIAAQRLRPIDDGGGYSGYYRQRCRVEVAIRLVVQRQIDGQVDAEARLNALHDAVAGVMCAWQPEGAELPFVWDSAADGEATESLMTADLIFSTSVMYANDTTKVTP